MNLEIGSIVGDYEVIGVLGAGGMGKVYKVRNTISDRVEAMKVLLPDLSGEPDLADRFLREIKVQASLDHPNIAHLRTAVRFENQLLMIMELVEGISLDQRLQQGPLPVAEAVGCIAQVLSALGYAHQNGVIHRDIKPANMMLTPSGTVKLMDFGIAKGAGDRSLTMTGTTMGSLYYMSPEQIRGTHGLDGRSDLYSLGVSLYELVTGKKPFDGDSQFAIMSAHLDKEPVPPVTVDPSLPEALNEVILLSVKKDPAERFQTAAAFRSALLSVVPAAVPAPAPVSTALPPAVKAASRPKRGLWVAAGALCMVAALVAMVQFGPWKKTSAGSPPPPQPVVSIPAPAPVVQAPTPPVEQPQQPPTSAPVPAALKPAVQGRPSAPQQARSQQTRPQQEVQPKQTQPQVVQQEPQPQPSVQQPTVISPAAAAKFAAAANANREALQTARESVATLSARAGSVHSAMQNMQRSQAASGLGMRGDWLEAMNLMDTYIRGASDALNAGDATAAQRFLDKAEIQTQKLEKALNRR